MALNAKALCAPVDEVLSPEMIAAGMEQLGYAHGSYVLVSASGRQITAERVYRAMRRVARAEADHAPTPAPVQP